MNTEGCLREALRVNGDGEMEKRYGRLYFAGFISCIRLSVLNRSSEWTHLS